MTDLSRARGVPATGEPGRAGSFIHRLARGGDVISSVTRRQGRATENPILASGHESAWSSTYSRPGLSPAGVLEREGR